MNRELIDPRKWKPAVANRMIALCLAGILVHQIAIGPPCVWANEQQASFKAGVASAVITPEHSMWMAGYAGRDKPSQGKVHDLYAKVLALQDARDTRLVILTLDLIGIEREMRDWLQTQVKQRHQLDPGNLLINASHTHCGPALRKSRYSIYGNSFYGLTPEQIRQCQEYSEHLQQELLQSL